MGNRIKTLLYIIIIPLFGLELFSRWNGNHVLEYIAKPWLMIWIAVYFSIFSVPSKTRLTIYLAFIFSWVGDMFLMVAHTREVFFYAGVGGFFLAQLFYIYTFLFVSGEKGIRGYLRCQPWWSLPLILYLAIILAVLSPGLEGIMLPIIVVYAISLIGMSLSALDRKYRVSDRSFSFVFIGSILFVISDSLIALDKFVVDIPRGSFIIILSYFVAQYLIMRGLLEEWKGRS